MRFRRERSRRRFDEEYEGRGLRSRRRNESRERRMKEATVSDLDWALALREDPPRGWNCFLYKGFTDDGESESQTLHRAAKRILLAF